MSSIRSTVIACVAAVALCGATRLQRYSDSYSGAVNVAGVRLVGLSRGSLVGSFSLGDLMVDVPSGTTGALCVAVTTRDARYYGEGSFVLDPPPGLQPLGLSSRWDATLGRYQRAEVAARAALRSNCDAGGPAKYLATGYRGQPSNGHFVALVNGGQMTIDLDVVDQRGVSLLGASVQTCRPVAGTVRTAFDTTCEFELTSAHRSAARTMRIGVTGITGRRTVNSFPILLGA